MNLLLKEENEMKKLILTVMMVAISVILTVSAGFAEEIRHSGFLENYSDLEPGPEGGARERYLKPGVDFKKYDKIMLDSVVFFLAEDAEYKGISAEDMKELSDTFHKAVVDALGKDYPLVGEAGPDVMRVRVAITKLKPSKPGAATITTIIPVGLALSFIRKGVSGEYTGVGSTGIEAEILDSLTNDRIAAAVDYKPGGKLAGFKKWSASKEAFEFWSGRLKTILDEAHGIAPKEK